MQQGLGVADVAEAQVLNNEFKNKNKSWIQDTINDKFSSELKKLNQMMVVCVKNKYK